MVTKLKKIKIQNEWKKEDKDFTPWLVENINLLNEQIGLNLHDPKKQTNRVRILILFELFPCDFIAFLIKTP